MFVGSRLRSVERWVVIDEVEDLLDYCCCCFWLTGLQGGLTV